MGFEIPLGLEKEERSWFLSLIYKGGVLVLLILVLSTYSPPPLTPHHIPSILSRTMSTSPTPTSLGPDVVLPEGLQQWRVMLLVTSMNSFAQKVWTYLQSRGINNITVHIMGDDTTEIVKVAEEWNADLILCPFLTKRIPSEVYTRVSPVILHNIY
jgi:hypothetical protein